MSKSLNLRATLLSTTALVLIGAMVPGAARAADDCVIGGGGPVTITCDGASTQAIDTNYIPTIITLNVNAVVDSTGAGYPTVYMSGYSSLIMGENSRINGSGHANSAVETAYSSNHITLNLGAEIVQEIDPAQNLRASTVDLNSEGDTSLTLNDESLVRLNAGTTAGFSTTFKGVGASGVGVTIELNNGSGVFTNGVGTGLASGYYGIHFYSDIMDNLTEASSITLNGGSQVVVHGSAANADGVRLAGITSLNSLYAEKYAADIELNGGSFVQVYADGANTKSAIGIRSQGLLTNVTLNEESYVYATSVGGGASVTVAGIATTGTGYSRELAGTITLNAGTRVTAYMGAGTTHGSTVFGIRSDSFGEYYYSAAVVLNSSVVSADMASQGYFYPSRLAVGVDLYGPGNLLTLNGTAEIQSAIDIGNPYKAFGARLRGDNGVVTLNDTSSIRAGRSNYLALGISVRGDGNQVELNGASEITVGDIEETYFATGIYIEGDRNTITLNGTSSVRTYQYKASNYNQEGAVHLRGGTGQSLTMNDYSTVISHSGNRADGVSLYGTTSATVTLNGHSSINAYSGYGIIIYGGENNVVTIGADASVSGRDGAIEDVSIGAIITVSGTVSTEEGPTVDLTGSINSTLILNSTTVLNGYALGNVSSTLILRGANIADFNVVGFGTLGVEATGIWEIEGEQTFNGNIVNVDSGNFKVNGTVNAADHLSVNNGGTLSGTGTINGDVNVNNGGILSPGNSPGTINVVGNVVFAAGSIFDVEVEATVADLLNVTGAVTIDPGAIAQATFIGPGADGFVGNIVETTLGVTGVFTVGGGVVLDYSDPLVVKLSAASPVSVDASIGSSAAAAFGFVDTVAGQTDQAFAVNKNFWATYVSTNSQRSGTGLAGGYRQHGTGGAFGGTVMQSGGFLLGLAAGYADTKSNATNGGSTAKIDGYTVAAYTRYETGNTFLTGIVTAGYQDMDIDRKILAGAVLVPVSGSTNAWVSSAGVGIGHDISLGGNFTLTPKASLNWVHQTRKGYTETGGAGSFSVDDVSSDTVRGFVGSQLSLVATDPNASWSVRPHITAGLGQEWREGDKTISGRFNAGGGFTATLDTRDQTYLTLGAGVDVTVGKGVTAFAAFDGDFGGDYEKSHSFRVGARINW
ncbi:MAG: autotransporter outer membrane beta-barrel domain-containing protein [Parvibaculum sp.]|nr:autotransporter outer membrane beta-barrel domain-containing protein [Parvibaculum sp.]